MNDEEYELEKRRVMDAADRWIPLLGLEHWTLNLEFERGVIGDTNVAERWQGLARTRANWPYQAAAIEFGLEGFQSLDAAGVEHHVVHELVHVLLDELQPDLEVPDNWRRNEHATELVTRALLRVR